MARLLAITSAAKALISRKLVKLTPLGVSLTSCLQFRLPHAHVVLSFASDIAHTCTHTCPDLISSQDFTARWRVEPMTMTSAPPRARIRAVSWPMPSELPVTMASLPAHG